MISSLRFLSGYPTRLKGIGKRAIVFRGWTNTIIGPNGSGKTTILRALAEAAGCGTGGWSDREGRRESTYAVSVERDDRPVFYQDCYTDSDKSFIDVDFLDQQAHLRSTGEKRIGLVNKLITEIENRFPTYKLSRDDRPTLLLDEVDNHVGFAAQSVLWGAILPKLSKKYQLIIATHSIFPVLLYRQNSLKPDHIIGLEPQYPETCVAELEKAIRHFNGPRG